MDHWIAPGEAPYLIGYLIVAMAFPANIALLVGSISRWRSPLAAELVGTFIIPAALLSLAGYIMFWPDDKPPHDMKGLAVLGLLIVAAITVPSTAILSFIAVRSATR